MVYYLTATSPLVFTTQKAEKVEGWMITAMLENLLKREYKIYEPEEAANNILYCLQVDSMFHEVPIPPKEEPKDADVKWWVQEFLMSEAGQNLLNQVNQPLHKQTEEEKEWLNDDTTLSDLMEGMIMV